MTLNRILVLLAFSSLAYFFLGVYVGKMWERENMLRQCSTQRGAFEQLNKNLSKIQRLVDEENLRRQFEVETSHGTAP